MGNSAVYRYISDFENSPIFHYLVQTLETKQKEPQV